MHTTVHERAHDPDKAARAGMQSFGEIDKQMQQRRAEGLGDELYSDILRGTLDGQPLDDVQVTMYGFLKMLGGIDTTSEFTGTVLLRLCDAELVFQVMLTQILERLPNFDLAGQFERFDDAGEVYAVRKLPIRFTPGQRKN